MVHNGNMAFVFIALALSGVYAGFPHHWASSFGRDKRQRHVSIHLPIVLT